ncbi:hypothetical protein F5148DRAFT_1280405 [Russula earlei]|uniref:Uncharacterized protein n=1 Tax=Russula earlei TaxID=71964 RepID=A0ACC0UK69_9AGAM|nr:hypothetical protein F5148DRAFT_1280405 [Russula earlei]
MQLPTLGRPSPSLNLSISVQPHSLVYGTAIAAANVIKKILTEAGFPAIEVSFVELVVTCSVSTSPKLLLLDPLLDNIPELGKPFSTALHHAPQCTTILTCAHVACPLYSNTGMTCGKESQDREDIIALGNKGYNNAIKAMMGTIDDLLQSVDAWNAMLGRLGKSNEGENRRTTKRLNEHLELVVKAKRKIN